MALARDRVIGPLGGLGGVVEALSVGRAVSLPPYIPLGAHQLGSDHVKIF